MGHTSFVVRHSSFVIALAAAALALGAEAKTIKLLAIGNSFSDDAVEHYLYDLAREGGDTLVIGNAYRGGQGFESHWRVVEQNKADFEYRKIVGGKRTNERRTLIDCLKDEDWDIITFQQVSQDTGDFATYEPWLTKLLDYVKANATNPNVVYGLHRTWAYAQHSRHGGFKKYDRDQMKMFNAIVDATNKARAAHPELKLLIPAGTAIQNGRTSFVGDNFNRDGYHLSYKLGRYTASLTWLEVVTGQSAIGKKFAPEGVDKSQIEVAQKAAHAAVAAPDKVTAIAVQPEAAARPPQVPVLESAKPQVDKAFKLAVETLYRNSFDEVIRAGGEYGGEWTRDVSINSWNAAALLIPEKTAFSLWSVTKNDRTLVGHQYWDKIIWVTAAYDFYLKSGDRDFLKQAYVASANTMKELEKEQFDADYGLFMGPSVFNDGIAGYEEPVFDTDHHSSFVLDYPGAKRIKCLSTNCIYFSGYRVLAKMASLEGDEAAAKDYLGKAAALKAAIRQHLYNADTGRTNYLVDAKGGVHPHQEALGLSFAILFGILDGDEARKAISEAYVSRFGIPSISPHFKRFDKDHPGRHNQIVWPFVNAFWADAARKSGRTDLFSFELQNLARLALASDDCFYEIYNETTGKVDGGWQQGHTWNSVYDQTWSATGYLRMVFSGLFGMKFSPEGVAFSPECKLLGEYGVKRLTGLRYRNGVLDITVSGKGSRLAAVKVNGKAQPPIKPVPPAAGTTKIELVLN